MTERKLSPRILGFTWGRLEVEGVPSALKDAKLFPGGCREWDWRETGTSHSPGVSQADLRELLDHGAREIVIGCGVHGRLEVPDETIRWLAEQGIPLQVLRTAEAVALYNARCRETAVGGLFHSTC